MKKSQPQPVEGKAVILFPLWMKTIAAIGDAQLTMLSITDIEIILQPITYNTIHGYVKYLKELNMIDVKKVGRKNVITLTELGRKHYEYMQWVRHNHGIDIYEKLRQCRV